MKLLSIIFATAILWGGNLSSLIKQDNFPDGQWKSANDEITINKGMLWTNGVSEYLNHITIDVANKSGVEVIYTTDPQDWVEGFATKIYILDRQNEVIYDAQNCFGIFPMSKEVYKEIFIDFNAIPRYHRVQRDNITESEGIPERFKSIIGLWSNKNGRILVSKDGIRCLRFTAAPILEKLDVLDPIPCKVVQNHTKGNSYLVYEDVSIPIDDRGRLAGLDRINSWGADMELYYSRKNSKDKAYFTGRWKKQGDSDSFMDIQSQRIRAHFPNCDIDWTSGYVLDDHGRLVSTDFGNVLIISRSDNGQISVTAENYYGDKATFKMVRF